MNKGSKRRKLFYKDVSLLFEERVHCPGMRFNPNRLILSTKISEKNSGGRWF